MRWKRRQQVEPPPPYRCEEKRRGQDRVGWPENGGRRRRESQDEAQLGAHVVGDGHGQKRRCRPPALDPIVPGFCDHSRPVSLREPSPGVYKTLVVFRASLPWSSGLWRGNARRQEPLIARLIASRCCARCDGHLGRGVPPSRPSARPTSSSPPSTGRPRRDCPRSTVSGPRGFPRDGVSLQSSTGLLVSRSLEGQAAGGAALLGVVIGEDHALPADPIDAGGTNPRE